MKNGEAQNCSEMGKEVGDLDKGKQLVVVDSNSKSKAKPAVEWKPRYDHRYPEPLTEYQDVVEDPKLFVDTLGKLHAAMSTEFIFICNRLDCGTVARIFTSFLKGGKGITDLKSALQKVFGETLVARKEEFLQTFSTQRNFIRLCCRRTFGFK